MAMLREQCSNHAKERAALKTILDAKIKSLVSDISRSLAELPPAEVSTDQLCSCSGLFSAGDVLLGLPEMLHSLACRLSSTLACRGRSQPSAS